ncbi:GGDEF domain-containing protein [Bradyrhizobium liaoningense]
MRFDDDGVAPWSAGRGDAAGCQTVTWLGVTTSLTTAYCACSHRRCPPICREAALRAGSAARSSPRSSAGGVAVAATVSVGLAHADSEPAGIEVLRERADKALYTAKALGRNQVESAVDDLVPLVPDASADRLIPSSQDARAATKQAAA